MRKLLRGMFLVCGMVVLLYVVAIGLGEEQMASQMSTNQSMEERMQVLLERNEEAKGFVEDYVNREAYIGKDIDLSADVEEGKVPLLMQWDKRWGYESMGNSNIGLSGCGPTCLSMAYLYFTGDLEGNPRKMAEFCQKNFYYTSEGTDWNLWTEGVKKLGMTGTELPLDENRMRSSLDEGKLIVCSMYPGDFTTVGHFILIIGYGEEGFVVNDPNRKSNSEISWSYETLKGQIRNLWELGKAD